MMTILTAGFFGLLATLSLPSLGDEAATTDVLFREIQRTVAEVDFDGMAAAYHPDAVLVAGGSTRMINSVMKRWKQAGEAFDQAGGEAAVSFRFSSRVQDDGASFDIGIFRYAAVAADGTENISYRHFENLAVYRNGRWLTLMERQLEAATEAEWAALPDW